MAAVPFRSWGSSSAFLFYKSLSNAFKKTGSCSAQVLKRHFRRNITPDLGIFYIYGWMFSSLIFLNISWIFLSIQCLSSNQKLNSASKTSLLEFYFQLDLLTWNHDRIFYFTKILSFCGRWSKVQLCCKCWPQLTKRLASIITNLLNKNFSFNAKLLTLIAKMTIISLNLKTDANFIVV